MPFHPGEQVNLRFVGDPETARLVVGHAEYTVANRGLEPKRDGGLIAIIQLPAVAPTIVEYEFSDGDRRERGKLRVVEPSQPAEPPAAATPGSVQPRQRGGT
ncbi:MAG TPA: hypothetical protein VK631_07260 [Solirubrobacteraceae bacterium]|nr:hypothetical protein [Solirubrobacteraceae bacterium]